jgi:hypothetical protein
MTFNIKMRLQSVSIERMKKASHYALILKFSEYVEILF